MTPEESAQHALRHGDRFPYDAPDAWWVDPSETPVPPPTDWAHRAARGILADLTDRRGIKHGFDGVDEEVRSDIVKSLAAIVRAALLAP